MQHTPLSKIVTVQECGDDLFIELPPDICAAAGFEIGDTIIWTQKENGSFLLTKKENS